MLDKSIRAHAATIAEHEEPPIKADVLWLRELMAAASEFVGSEIAAARYRSGQYDDKPRFQVQLAYIRANPQPR